MKDFYGTMSSASIKSPSFVPFVEDTDVVEPASECEVVSGFRAVQNKEMSAIRIGMTRACFLLFKNNTAKVRGFCQAKKDTLTKSKRIRFVFVRPSKIIYIFCILTISF